MSKIPICTQATSKATGPPVRVEQNIGGWPLMPKPPYLDPKEVAIEVAPPLPRPPDPLPLPPRPVPPLPPPTPTPTLAWTGVDAYWWMTLIRANSAGAENEYVERTLSAKAPYRRFQRFPVSDHDVVLRTWTARMDDRFYIGVEGTANSVQLLSYVFTHAYGEQSVTQGAWFNDTFRAQGEFLAALVRTDWETEGKPPLCIVAHSYGGGAAPALYLNLVGTQPDPYDRIVTAGSPRNLTASAITALGSIQYIRFANAGDPVPLLPPTRAVINRLTGILNPGNYQGGDYSHLNPGLEMQEDGGAIPRGVTSPTTAQWASQFASFIKGGLDFEPHFARDYARLGRRWNDASPQQDAQGYANYIALYGINDDLAAAGV